MNLPTGLRAIAKVPRVNASVEAPNPSQEKGILTNPSDTSTVVRVPNASVQPTLETVFLRLCLGRTIDQITRIMWLIGFSVEVSAP